MNDYNTAICIVGICLVITALVILINHLRTKKTIDTIENMLNEAVKGNFSEKSFDETRLSSLETRFAHYLSASVVSARNVELEKDKIKSLIADISHQTKTPIANPYTASYCLRRIRAIYQLRCVKILFSFMPSRKNCSF